MECKVCIGDRIILSLKNGTSYEGDVNNFSEKTRRLTLKNISQIPQDIEIEGYRYFEENEIKQIKVIHSPESLMQSLRDVKLSEEEDECETKYISLKISTEEYNKILDKQKYFRFIETESANFYKALSSLEHCRVMGLCMEDSSKGRIARGSIIAIDTEKEVFLFDLENLGDKVFDKGLRKVLQSPLSQKIVYNCPLLSDCLYHKHKTYLENVSDVEAEDMVIMFQKEGYVREHSQSLGYLVEFYLGIPSESLNFFHSPVSWNKRPLAFEQQKYLATKVSFLTILHREIQKYYLKRLVDTSRLYNEYIRDLDMITLISEGSKFSLHKKLVKFLKHKSKTKNNSKNN